MKIENGTTLNQYKILSPIGKGGMGEVFLAQDTRLDRKVALKILPPEFAEDKDRMARFVLEAKSVSALNHPNIITIHEIGEQNGTHFITTEFIDGLTLGDYAKSKSLDYKTVLEIAVQVMSALDEAHSAGIIHRDIKPDNIMVRSNGLVKVLDFGIAKFAAPTEADEEIATAIKTPTKAGMIIGTPKFMSPEQARGKDVDHQTDIFSFGVVLYYMLSGASPFSGETASDVLAAVLTKEPEQLRGVPAALEQIVSKTLQKDKRQRYQTAKELLQDLKEIKQELEIQSHLARASSPNLKEQQTQLPEPTTREAQPTAPTTNPEDIELLQRIGLPPIETKQIDESLEAKTAMLSSGEAVSEAPLQHPIITDVDVDPDSKQPINSQSAIRNPKSKWWLFCLLGLLVLLIGVFTYKSFAPASKQIKSIAVLPFENKSVDPDTDYLSDGLAESLIYHLSQLPDLKVSPTSSVFRYKGKQTDPQVVAKELGVDSVMTGRITQRGDNLNISVNLVDTRNNKSLWGEQYERKMSELLGTQREIATEITNKLQLQLSGQGEEALAKQYTTNAEAYQLYLKGNYYKSKYSDEGYKKAIDYYQQAINIDPNYALAYTGIANTYLSVAEVYFPMSEGMPKAKTAVLTALKIDNSLAEAHALLGAISIWYDWDWAAGERELKRAIELDPNNAESHHQYGWYFAMTGKLDQAIAEAELAHRLAPLDINISGDLGGFYYFSGRNDDALRQSQKTIEIDSNSGIGYNGLGIAYAAKRQFPEAIAAMEKAHSLDDSPWLSGFRGYVYATAGKKIEAQKVLDELGELSKRRYVPAYNVAFIYAGLNDNDKAFELLNKGFQTHSGLSVIKVEPSLSSLRNDPRFEDLLKRMNLPE